MDFVSEIYLDISYIRKNRYNESIFSDYLRKISFESGIDVALKAIKISDISFKRGKNEVKNHLLKKYLLVLRNDFDCSQKISQFNSEMEILKNLYSNFYRRLSIYEVMLGEDERLAAFLVAMENFLSLNIQGNLFKTNDEMIDNYFNSHWIEALNISSSGSISLANRHYLLEEIIFSFKDSLKYIKTGKFINESLPITERMIANSSVHLHHSIQFFFLDHLFELWAYADATITKTHNQIEIQIGNIDNYKSWMVSNYRQRISMTPIWEKDDFTQTISLNKKTKMLPPDQYISNQEYYDVLSAREIFFTSDLNQKIFSIPIKVWIRAYNNIITYAKNKLITRVKSKIPRSNIKKFFKFKSKVEWIKIIAISGVSIKNASIIFDFLVFNQTSRCDLFDNPFVKVDNDKYILLCSVATIIDPMLCLLSIIRSHEKLKFRGQNYENVFEKIFKTYNLDYVRNVKIVKKVSNNSSPKLIKLDLAEFDYLIKLDEILLLIELKCHIHAFSFDEHYKLFFNLKHEINKFHHSNAKLWDNFDLIKNKFKSFFQNWEPTKITKIIICSNKLGQSIKSSDCLVLDLEGFLVLLRSNNYSRIVSTKKLVLPPTFNLHDRLIKESNSPRVVLSAHNDCKLITREEKFEEYTIFFPQYDKYK